MRTIAICNQAGGVGKTTTTRDLGYELMLCGCKVFLLDADSQGSLGEYLGCHPHQRPAEEMFWSSLCNDTSEQPHVVEKYDLQVGLSNLLLAKGERLLVQQRNPMKLYGALQHFQSQFDFILIDCPPHISEMTVQALIAADEILIPVQTEDKAVAGLYLIQEEIIEANKRRLYVRPPLKLTGILPTLYDARLNLHRHYLGEIHRTAEQLGCQVFQPVRRAIAVAEACNARLPLKLYSATCPVNEDMEQLAKAL